jgi:hypothetical protein
VLKIAGPQSPRCHDGNAILLPEEAGESLRVTYGGVAPTHWQVFKAPPRPASEVTGCSRATVKGRTASPAAAEDQGHTLAG